MTSTTRRGRTERLTARRPEEMCCDNLTPRLTAAWSDHREAPLKKWNILPNQLGPPLPFLFGYIRPRLIVSPREIFSLRLTSHPARYIVDDKELFNLCRGVAPV